MPRESGASSTAESSRERRPSRRTGSSAFADNDIRWHEKKMTDTEIEIAVDDPTAPEDDSPAVTSKRTVDVVVSLLLLALAATLGFDNWRTGIGWDATGPEPG